MMRREGERTVSVHFSRIDTNKYLHTPTFQKQNLKTSLVFETIIYENKTPLFSIIM